jgi:hypothetical protein
MCATNGDPERPVAKPGDEEVGVTWTLHGTSHGHVVPEPLQRRWPRWAAILFVTAAIGLHPGAGRSGERAAPSPPVLEVTLENGLLSVNARNAPLGDVLRTIGKQAAVLVTVADDVDDRVTATLTRVPLEEGLRQLARGHSVLLVFEASPGWMAPPRLAEIQVYRGSGVPPAAAAEVVPALAAPSADMVGPDEAWNSRLSAIAATGQRGDAVAAEYLAHVLGEDPDPRARVQAIRALRRIGGEPALDGLSLALGDTDHRIRMEAISAYVAVAAAGRLSTLGEIVSVDPDPEVRRYAVRVLARLGTPEALGLLARAASDPSDMVRDAVGEARRAPRRR